MNANGLAVEFEWVRQIRAQFTQSDKCNDIPEQEKTCIKQIHVDRDRVECMFWNRCNNKKARINTRNKRQIQIAQQILNSKVLHICIIVSRARKLHQYQRCSPCFIYLPFGKLHSSKLNLCFHIDNHNPNSITTFFVFQLLNSCFL